MVFSVYLVTLKQGGGGEEREREREKVDIGSPLPLTGNVLMYLPITNCPENLFFIIGHFSLQEIS